jgi:hypothetical protein
MPGNEENTLGSKSRKSRVLYVYINELLLIREQAREENIPMYKYWYFYIVQEVNNVLVVLTSISTVIICSNFGRWHLEEEAW